MQVYRNKLHSTNQYLIGQLLHLQYFKTPDGRQLYELTKSELEGIFKQFKGEGRRFEK